MNLKHLSDKTLLNEMQFWSAQERAALIQVLWRLKEVEERKLFSDLKCTSLFDYCVTVLKYSEGQASRRVSAARLLKQMPELSEDIESGALNLTQLNQAKNFFENEKIKDLNGKKEIIEKMKGKTTRETEKLLADLKNDDSPRRVSLSLLEETVQELRKLQALKAHSCPNMDFLLKKMCAEVGRVWDPGIVLRGRAGGKVDTRYVQVGVKAEVWNRDKGKCTNCGSEYALELDHIEPFAKGGSTTVENLQLLCRSCNQRKAIVDFGRRSAFK